MLAKKLFAETKKQLEKAREKRKYIKARNKKGEEFLANIDAYISDCGHFLRQKQEIEAFEAAVWAWAWLEIGEMLGLLKEKKEKEKEKKD